MIQSFTLPVLDDGVYTFPNSNVGFNSLAGFGSSKSKTGQHEYSAAHGGTTLSQFYRTRRMAIGGYLVGQDVATYAQARRDLERAFTFDNAERLLQFTTDDGIQLQTNVIIPDGSEIAVTPISLVYATWQVELDGADPLFYAPSQSLQGGVTTVTGGVIIPVTIPVTLSATVTGALSVNNTGNARVFPTSVTITGPGTDFIISNKTTGKDFLYNDTLLSTDSVVFDFKRETATKNGTINEYGLTGGDWWELGVGANIITFTVGSGNTSGTKLNISWKSAYLGA